jgi:glycosyltransferase involved in cell wall biosynthesis
LKILLIHNNYQQLGGEQVAVEAQTDLLRQHGHHVVLYLRDSTEIKEYNFFQKTGFFSNTVFSKDTYREVHNLIASEQPDVVHVHNVFPLISPSVYQVLKDVGIPVVQTMHNFRFLCPNALFYTHEKICERCKYGNTLHAVQWKCYRQSYPLSALYALSVGWHRQRGTFRQIDRFIALTAFGAQKLQESGLAKPEQITILGNFISDPLPEPGSFRERQPYVLYLGRLSPEKGANVLIEAMASAPHLQLKIAGDGPEFAALQRLMQQQGMHQIEFLGRVHGPQKWDLLRNATALIVPSVCYEQFPITLLESFVTGTPAIVSDIGSLPYIVQDGENGLLFEAGSIDSLAEKLNWAASHPGIMMKMGEHAREIFEREYSAEAHYPKLLKIYCEVTG